MKMEQVAVVYQDRILKITKRLSEKGSEYTIKMTDGRRHKAWEERFNSDEEALESARKKFGNFYKEEA